MKKIIVLFFITILFSYAYAHSGRTDSKGGHYDRSTGLYHYHHGYSAHQHPNGICPYDSKKDKNEILVAKVNSIKQESQKGSLTLEYMKKRQEELKAQANKEKEKNANSDSFLTFISLGGVLLCFKILSTNRHYKK